MKASYRGAQEKIYWGVHTKSENRFSLLKLMLLKIKYTFKTRLKKVSRWRFHTPHYISRLLCVSVSTVCVRTPIKETYWCTNSWACWQNDISQKTVFQYVIIFLFQHYRKIRVSLNERWLTTVLQLCHTLGISLSSNLEASANSTWKC